MSGVVVEQVPPSPGDAVEPAPPPALTARTALLWVGAVAVLGAVGAASVGAGWLLQNARVTTAPAAPVAAGSSQSARPVPVAEPTPTVQQEDPQPEPVVEDPDAGLPRLDAAERGTLFEDVVLIRDVVRRGERLVVTFDRLQETPDGLLNTNSKLRTAATSADFTLLVEEAAGIEPIVVVYSWVVPGGVMDPYDMVSFPVRLTYDGDGLITSMEPAF